MMEHEAMVCHNQSISDTMLGSERAHGGTKKTFFEQNYIPRLTLWVVDDNRYWDMRYQSSFYELPDLRSPINSQVASYLYLIE